MNHRLEGQSFSIRTADFKLQVRPLPLNTRVEVGQKFGEPAVASVHFGDIEVSVPFQRAQRFSAILDRLEVNAQSSQLPQEK